MKFKYLSIFLIIQEILKELKHLKEFMLDKFEVEKFRNRCYLRPYRIFSPAEINKILVQIKTDTAKFEIPGV